MALMFATAMDEWREAGRVSEAEAGAALVERVGRVMSVTLDREILALERHLPSLATIGATAPFVGLFGTVWGIMNSFTSIAATKNTTLAVVAPGHRRGPVRHRPGPARRHPGGDRLQQALGRSRPLRDRLQSFADEFAVVVSRELDGGRVD